MPSERVATAEDPLYDVIQIGYGPVSQVLALMLARRGWRVAIFERWKTRYSLPRAVCVDHEMARMLHQLGMRETLARVSHPAPVYRWFNAEWQELLHLDWSRDAVSGGSEVNFVHQPTLEEMFDRTVSDHPLIDVNLGCEAIAVSQTDDHAEVTVRDSETGGERRVRAKFLIGTDGANSLTRQSIGATQEDFGFKADWLVIDILPNEGAELDIPVFAQWCNPKRPTTIVPAGIREGRYYRRWEFMRLPDETIAGLESDDVAWSLLEPWVKPHQAAMVRNKVYSFRSLVATGWRKERVLIAGDAAHVMPPFMGQGMCAGFRDGWNLAWKLDLVLSGKAEARLLDTYEPERRPHVKDIIEISMFLGKIICIPDAAAAAERDRMFLSGEAPPPPPFPCLTDGLLDRTSAGTVRAPAGLLCPQARISLDGREGWFDDVAGTGFVMIGLDDDPRAAMTASQTALLEQLDIKVAVIAREGVAPRQGQAVEYDNRYRDFMVGLGIAVMLIRPDFYLYGGAPSTAEAGALAGRLAADLDAHGMYALGVASGPAVIPVFA